MAAINLPFAASATKRAPNAEELTNGFPCGDADKQLFDWLEWWLTGQIANAIAKSGLPVDDTDLLRLAKVIRSQGMNYRAATGTANAIAITLDPAPAALSDLLGVPLRIKIAADNTGAATLSVNGLPPQPIRRADGPLQAGDLKIGAVQTLIYDGAAFQVGGLISGVINDAIAANAPNGFRNLVINGDFRINQRSAATKAQSVGVYGYDRWKGHAAGLEQVVEGINVKAGKHIITWDGGGSGLINGAAVVSGSIVDLVGGANVSVVVPADADKVQLAQGELITPFELRPYLIELFFCHRYFVRIKPGTAGGRISIGMVLDNGEVLLNLPLPAPLRTTPPSVAYLDLVRSRTADVALTSLISVNSWVNSNILSIRFQSTTVTGGPLICFVQAATVAGYLDIDAEF